MTQANGRRRRTDESSDHIRIHHSCRRMCCSSQLERSRLARKLNHKLLEHSRLVRRLNRMLQVHSMLARKQDHSRCRNQLVHSMMLQLEHSKLAQRCIRSRCCS